jgi:hypothetical protein
VKTRQESHVLVADLRGVVHKQVREAIIEAPGGQAATGWQLSIRPGCLQEESMYTEPALMSSAAASLHVCDQHCSILSS